MQKIFVLKYHIHQQKENKNFELIDSIVFGDDGDGMSFDVQKSV